MEEENESDHFEPIRMRLMADEMFQLTFQIENLDPKPRMSRSITATVELRKNEFQTSRENK